MKRKNLFYFGSLLILTACTSTPTEVESGDLLELGYEPITAEDLASDQLMMTSVDQATGEKISFREEYLTFGFPSSAGWRFSGLTDEGTTHVSVPDNDYEVFLDFKVTRLTKFQEVSDAAMDNVTLGNGAELYRIPFGGGYDLAYLNFGDHTYEITVEVSSSEPVPENLDGVWVPHTDVTREDLWALYQTVQLYSN